MKYWNYILYGHENTQHTNNITINAKQTIIVVMKTYALSTAQKVRMRAHMWSITHNKGRL